MLKAEVWFTKGMRNAYHTQRGMATYRNAESKALAAAAAPSCGCSDPDRIGNGRLTTVFITVDGVVRRVRKCRGCMIEHDIRKNGR